TGRPERERAGGNFSGPLMPGAVTCLHGFHWRRPISTIAARTTAATAAMIVTGTERVATYTPPTPDKTPLTRVRNAPGAGGGTGAPEEASGPAGTVALGAWTSCTRVTVFHPSRAPPR